MTDWNYADIYELVAREIPDAPCQVQGDRIVTWAKGVRAREGLTTGDPEEAAMKRALAGRAAETLILASAVKIGAASPYLVFPVDQVNGIITDVAATDPTITQLRQRDITIYGADQDPATHET